MSKVWGGALLVVAAVVILAIAKAYRSTVEVRGAPSTLETTLAIEPFRAPDSLARLVSEATIPESLAARLKRMPGLEVLVSTREVSQRANFTLRGDVATQNGRIVVVALLYQRGRQSPVWTATFWRDRAATATIVNDVAPEVAEALYGYLARGSVTGSREGP